MQRCSANFGMGEGRDCRAVGYAATGGGGAGRAGRRAGLSLGVLQIKGEFVIFALVIV